MRVIRWVVLGVLFASAARADPETPRSADAFVDSIGVEIPEAAVRNQDALPRLGAKLQGLGVRHLRASIDVQDHGELEAARQLAVPGSRWDLALKPGTPITAVMEALKSLGPAVDAVECPGAAPGHPAGTPSLRDTCERLFQAIKRNPSTHNVLVLAPAPGSGDSTQRNAAQDLDQSLAPENGDPAASLPDLSRVVDAGNMTVDPFLPLSAGDTVTRFLAAQRISGAASPVVATPASAGEGQADRSAAAPDPAARPSGPSESARAKLLLGQYLEDFHLGVLRTWAADLVDLPSGSHRGEGEPGAGLLHPDRSETPAFSALGNTIALLRDPGPAFRPDLVLDYTFRGLPENVHHTLLVKRNGSFDLVLWQDPGTLDPGQSGGGVPPEAVVMDFNQPIHDAAVYLPGRSTTPVEQYANPHELILNVGDEPLIMQITPLRPGADREPSSVDWAQAVVTAQNLVRLVWIPAARGTVPAGYVVYRSLARGVPPGSSTQLTILPGRVFDDITALPGRTYVYRVAAIDDSGHLGPPSPEVEATTRNP